MAHITETKTFGGKGQEVPYLCVNNSSFDVAPATKGTWGREIDWTKEENFKKDEWDVTVTVTKKFKPFWVGYVSKSGDLKGKITDVYYIHSESDAQFYKESDGYVRIETPKEISK